MKEEQEKKEREDSRNRKFATKIQNIQENKRKQDTFRFLKQELEDARQKKEELKQQEKKDREDSRNRKFATKIQNIQENKRKQGTFRF